MVDVEGLVNKMQQGFIKSYLISNDATQEAIAAGYAIKNASKMGYKLLNKPHIRKVINEHHANKVSKEKYKDGILDCINRAKTDTRPNALNAEIKAHELLGKVMGYLPEGK